MPSIAAQELLAQLDYARENASEQLAQAGALLESTLSAAGTQPHSLTFDCHAARDTWLSVALLLFTVMLLTAAWRSRRWLIGCALALTLGLAGIAGLADPLLPSARQTSIEVVVEPREPSRSEVVLAAHYDSKTELFDHVERSVLFGASVLLAGATILLRLRRPRRVRVVASAAAFATLLCALQWSALPLRGRSHGAIDDGAACVLLVQLATTLQTEPLQRTRVRLVWFSGEEVGAQGSAAYLRARRVDEPVRVINLEGIGAGSRLATSSHEWTWPGIRSVAPELLAALERAAGEPLVDLVVPLFTDAGMFLRAGLGAVTLLNVAPGAVTIRHLHGPGDRMHAVDWRGYEKSRRTLLRFLAAIDDET
ncbi:MAG: M28 family peptidase [Candidatus Latescibacterota bacterium]|nr:MAG: M28 family peptidase [Candidatus Latescibacterota bacterium]